MITGFSIILQLIRGKTYGFYCFLAIIVLELDFDEPLAHFTLQAFFGWQ